MRLFASVATFVTLCSALALPAQAASIHLHRGPTSGHAAHHGKHTAAAKKIHGQRQIDSERATEIQTALIKAHYLDGAPTGQWDSTTEAAMRKMQADNGWQTKITPDSRALIKLGLGPDHSTDLGAVNSAPMLGAPSTSSASGTTDR